MIDRGDFSIVRFSTDDLPEKHRAEIWREHFGPSIFKVEIEPPPPDTPLKVDMATRSLPGLQLLSGLYAPGGMIRTRRLIAEDGNDDFILRINTSGAVIVSGAGREVDHGFGAVLTNAAEASALHRPTFGGSTVIRIPRSVLSALVIDVDDITMRPIPPHMNSLNLLIDYTNALLSDDMLEMLPKLRHLVVNQVTDLVALTLGATRDAAHIAENRGVPAARLYAAKAYVTENSSRQTLSVADVARHLGLSNRQVQRLFENDGTTFSNFLLDYRLACAHRMLFNSQYLDWSIGRIADCSGFNDLSYFGRCFRKRYGCTPRDARNFDPNSRSVK
jgi:AraC-like DNA-binding protein